MAFESCEANLTRGSSTTRLARGFVHTAAAGAVLLVLTAALSAQGGDKAKVSELVKSDLSRLADLERTWYAKNRTFTIDLRALGFAPASGANITMAYATARSWSARALHPTLQPTTCLIVGAPPSEQSGGDRPFCLESADTKQVAAAPTTPVQRPQPVAPAKTEPKPAPAARRPVATPVPTTVPTTVVEIPARAPSGGAALANTRAAGGVADAGVTEVVTPAQFSERLRAIVASALEMMNAKMPDVARDPYESSDEYQARVAEAYAAFERHEGEFYARNTRTYVVSMPVKNVRYDADREVVKIAVDPMPLPITRSFAAADGARLSVACYTRPYFWCNPDSGMSYDGTDLWRVQRAAARTADVLNTPLTLVARFVVGRRDDARSPAVSLLSMELQAKGAALSRWDSGTR